MLQKILMALLSKKGVVSFKWIFVQGTLSRLWSAND